MTRSLVFSTPGILDIRSITMFGVSSKPNSPNPIGFFGTGMKYAVAVLLRLGHEIMVYRGGHNPLTFSTVKDTFRDKELDFIHIQEFEDGEWVVTDKLSYTTDYGKKWELWMAFRELYSNTIDEDGECFVLNEDDQIALDGTGRTWIEVYGDEFVQEWEQRDKHFLPDGLRVRGDASVQIIDRPSSHVYYRGLRVCDLEKPSKCTYNILAQMDLTEDRTIKYSFYMDMYIREAITRSAGVFAIEHAVTGDKNTYEHKLNFNEVSSEPSREFQFVLAKKRERQEYMNPSARSYFHEHSPSYLRRQSERHYLNKLIDFVRDEKWDKAINLMGENKPRLLDALAAIAPKEDEIKSIEDLDVAA